MAKSTGGGRSKRGSAKNFGAKTAKATPRGAKGKLTKRPTRKSTPRALAGIDPGLTDAATK